MSETAFLLIGLGVLFVMLVPKTAFGYVRGEPVELTLESIGHGFYMRADAARAFRAMSAAAGRDGVELEVNSAFRTMEKQLELFKLYQTGTGPLTAEPGWSKHQDGTAVDIESAGGSNAASAWLAQNAYRFGFRRTVTSEPWHHEFRP